MEAIHQKKRTELQQLCEDMRIAQLHLVNLLTMALKEADDELESVLAGAIKFSQDDYELWERISAIADDLAMKRARCDVHPLQSA